MNTFNKLSLEELKIHNLEPRVIVKQTSKNTKIQLIINEAKEHMKTLPYLEMCELELFIWKLEQITKDD